MEGPTHIRRADDLSFLVWFLKAVLQLFGLFLVGVLSENTNCFCVLITELNKNPVEGFSAGLIDDDDIYQWEVVIIGPADTLL